MRTKEQKRNVVLPAVLSVCLLLFLTAGGAYFTRYLQEQIFVERTTQLDEITAQVRANLDNALNFHWNDLTAAVNIIEQGERPGQGDVSEIGRAHV